MGRSARRWLSGLFLVSVTLIPMQGSICLASKPESVSRFGVGLSAAFGKITDYNTAMLNIGWYSDWTIRLHPARPNGLEYVQLVRVRKESYPPNWDTLAAIVRANPGSLWLVGNEPEAFSQDNRTPAEYAEIYHEVHTFIKGHDATARLAIGSVVQPTPLRRKWLGMVLQVYRSLYGVRMPIDVWSIHVQILQERRGDWGCGIPVGLTEDEGQLYAITDNADPDIFRQLVLDFRQWLNDQGETDKPLVISEFGVLMPSEYLAAGDRAAGDLVAMAFMSETFDFLLNARDPVLGYSGDDHRLVQKWLWYSLNEPYYDFDTLTGMNGGLYDAYDPTKLTHLGAHFVHYTTGQLDNTNLVGGSRQVFLPIVFPLATVFPERPEGRNHLRSDYGEYADVSLSPAAYRSETDTLARR